MLRSYLFIEEFEVRGALVFDILRLFSLVIPVIVLFPLFVILVLVVITKLEIVFLFGLFAVCIQVSVIGTTLVRLPLTLYSGG